MYLHRRRAAMATLLVSALIGWGSAGVAAAESKWTGTTSAESKWTIVTPTESKWT